jgi:hypothetical protein
VSAACCHSHSIPGFAANRYLYVCFTETSGDIAVERFTLPVSANAAPSSGVESTAVRVLTIAHRAFANHNGGQLQFGPDGMLYLGTGDGGGAGDPLGSGQNVDTLLGKILRLNVRTLPYQIPPDNPFVGSPASVRRSGHTAFAILGGSRSTARRTVCTSPTSARIAARKWTWSPPTPRASTMVERLGRHDVLSVGQRVQFGRNHDAVLDYDHENGCSITGGYVYRGALLPEVAGRYFYSDFCNGWLRSFLVVNGVATERLDWHVTPIGSIQSFGVDSRSELYALTSGGGVYRLVRE